MKKRASIIPLESAEQETLVDWLELKGLKFTAIPNSTYTTSWSQKAKNKRMGLRSGLPDLLVIISKDQSKCGNAYLIFVELKRLKGGRLSDSQSSFINALNEVNNVQAIVSYGAQEAIDFITVLIK